MDMKGVVKSEINVDSSHRVINVDLKCVIKSMS